VITYDGGRSEPGKFYLSVCDGTKHSSLVLDDWSDCLGHHDKHSIQAILCTALR